MNSNGDLAPVPKYPKGDLRRMLAVLGAIYEGAPASLSEISRSTGLDRKTVFDLIDKARLQADVTIEKNGSQYVIVSWGRVIIPQGAVIALRGEL